MIEALRKQIKPIILIFPVSSHGSNMAQMGDLADQTK